MSMTEPLYQTPEGEPYHWSGFLRRARPGDVVAEHGLTHPDLQPYLTAEQQATRNRAVQVKHGDPSDGQYRAILLPGKYEEAKGLQEALRGERPPKPGDLIRIPVSFYGNKAGSTAILHSPMRFTGEVSSIDAEGNADPGYEPDHMLATFRPNGFRGPSSPYLPEDSAIIVDCSGGPSPLIRLADLHPTGEESLQEFWRWREHRGAQGDMHYRVRVPIWEWIPPSTWTPYHTPSSSSPTGP